MKTTWPILALALCAGFAQATPPAGPPEGHAAAAASDAHAHHHAHADHHGHVQAKVHAHVPPAAPHDADAAKWAPDAPLMTGMRRLHAALEGGQHHGAHAAGDPAHALQLASRIDAAVAYMFEHCALPPEPDVALHGVLARMMAGARALRGLFARPSAWRVLDCGIAVLMGFLGVGLLIAALVAACVGAASGFMTGGSALFTRNVYQRFLRPGEAEKPYLSVGRVASLAVVLIGVLTALTLESVISGLEWMWRLMAFLGIAFWMAIFWRRANRYGAWASVIVTAALSLVTDNLGWSFPAQVILYLPAGFISLVVVSYLTRPEPERALNVFYSLLNTPVGEERRLKAAGIETIHERELTDSEEAMMPEERATAAAVAPPALDRVLDDDAAARRGESLLLVNLLSLPKNFSWRRYRVDLTGFLNAWAIVAGIILLTYGIVWVIR